MVKTEDNIILYCAASYGEEIYLKLTSNGYHVIAFCDNSKRNENLSLFGVPVYSYKECCLRYPEAVYIISNSTYATAIEIGIELEKDGYIKDWSYFISIELELQGLLSYNKKGIEIALNNKTVILFGNKVLCNLFEEWAENLIDNFKLYVCYSESEIDFYRNEYSDAIWIPLEKGDFCGGGDSKEKSEILLQVLYNYGVRSFSRFFSNHMVYCIENNSLENDIDSSVKYYGCHIQKVVFLKTSSFSGSTFIDAIFDSHPNILYLGLINWSFDIWYIIKKVLFTKNNIIDTLIGQIKYFQGNYDIEWLDNYKQILDKYIKEPNIYSEKELFIIIHVAYYELLHGKIPCGEMVIYMDIHSNMLMRDVVFSWLEYMGFEIILLEMIRNPYKRLGSGIKFTLGENNGMVSANTILNLLYDLSGETLDNEEKKYSLVRIRFEDLKLYPYQILKKLCNILEIPWDDIFLETTFAGKESVYISNGEKITGFDLKPVYHTYDEYFDAFDKFRLDLIFREKNKAYGYSYTDKSKYLPLEEIGKLFSLPFSIEKYISFKDEKDKMRFRNKIGFLCTQLLVLEESVDKYAGHFQFGPCLAVEGEI